jgi:addiction module HigA family antidote
MKKEAAKLSPLHPGEVLREEFMEPYGLSAYALAKACHIPRTRIERIAREETGITTDTALRLAAFFGTTAEFWLNLQNRFEMETIEPEIRAVLETIEPGEQLVAA